MSVVVEADAVVRLFQSQAVTMMVEIVLVVCTFMSQSFTQVDVRAAVVKFNSGYLQICSARWREREPGDISVPGSASPAGIVERGCPIRFVL